MTNRFLLPLYLCFVSLPSFAADSGGVETWSPVIRPGAPSRSAKSDEQEKRKAESKLHQLSAEKSALAEENQRLKARLEKALDPKGSKENEKSSPASAAQSQEGGREYPSELEDLLRRHHALKNKDHAAYLPPPSRSFPTGFTLPMARSRKSRLAWIIFRRARTSIPCNSRLSPLERTSITATTRIFGRARAKPSRTGAAAPRPCCCK